MSIASEITRLQGAKADIKTAIEGKGGTVGAEVLLDGYAALIDDISTGTDISDTTAVAGDVRDGEFFYIADGTKTEGTLVVLDTSDANATAADIEVGKTAYVDGEKLTGTLVNWGDEYYRELIEPMDVWTNTFSYIHFDIGTTDLTTGATATASSVFGANVAAQAIDDNAGTAWQPSGTDYHWIKIDLGSGNEKSVGKITMTEHASYSMNQFTLAGSNDNSNWTSVLVQSTNAGNSPTITFLPLSETEFRYYRLISNYSFGSYLLYELQLFEYTKIAEG